MQDPRRQGDKSEKTKRAPAEKTAPPVTPDGRYFVVRGRLWRMANPRLDPGTKKQLVADLMSARRAVRHAKNAGDKDAERAARARVNAAKIALGERGPVWWDPSEADYNRHLAANTPYAAWYATLDRTRH